MAGRWSERQVFISVVLWCLGEKAYKGIKSYERLSQIHNEALPQVSVHGCVACCA